MNPLSVFCPVTGRSVRSGIETDWSTFFSLGAFRLRVQCSECGDSHEIRVRECYLARSQATTESRVPALPENPQLDGLLMRIPSRA